MSKEPEAESRRLKVALEKISDKLAYARMDDCENGVKWLNVRAANRYLHDYRHTREALAEIEAIIGDALREGE